MGEKEIKRVKITYKSAIIIFFGIFFFKTLFQQLRNNVIEFKTSFFTALSFAVLVPCIFYFGYDIVTINKKKKINFKKVISIFLVISFSLLIQGFKRNFAIDLEDIVFVSVFSLIATFLITAYQYKKLKKPN
ncbi:MAG: hypothetical protein KAI43_10540 [Candidatus Aureabacteria bacterium]|nr:hypothetical protein [Candidatus Auribacterota bacterium]